MSTINFATQLEWVKSRLARCEKLAAKHEAKGNFANSWRQQAKRWKWLLDYLQAREPKP